MPGVRLPGDAVLPGVASLRGPLSCLNEARYGIVFGTLGGTGVLTAGTYNVAGGNTTVNADLGGGTGW